MLPSRRGTRTEPRPRLRRRRPTDADPGTSVQRRSVKASPATADVDSLRLTVNSAVHLHGRRIPPYPDRCAAHRHDRVQLPTSGKRAGEAGPANRGRQTQRRAGRADTEHRLRAALVSLATSRDEPDTRHVMSASAPPVARSHQLPRQPPASWPSPHRPTRVLRPRATAVSDSDRPGRPLPLCRPLPGVGRQSPGRWPLPHLRGGSPLRRS